MSDHVLVWLLLEQDGAALLGLRKAGRPPFAGSWVLPGDEMPEEESASETLARFARDQLDLSVASEEFADTINLVEAGDAYAVNIFRVTGGQPRFRESGPYSDVRWLTSEDLGDATAYPMPEALRRSLASAIERRPT
ncbi:MAG: hypothetical protein GEU75_10230 [Dehalococcoidia bacterium]|nr:hypothetical protein [Dehalococcoidia bacterium]